MIARQTGCIINLASFAATRPYGGDSAYAASKAALITLTKVLALEVRDFNISVNAILPGFTMTGDREARLRGGGNAFRPDTSLPLALFLASQDPVRVTGELIHVIEWNEQHGFGGKGQWLAR